MPAQIIRAKDRYHHETDWLSTYWHFSFDHYHDPKNVAFGPLRVFNDDTVQPGTGFPPHSHADMEIISYVLSGALEHRDSGGHRGVIGPGEVQVMSAASGITHAEYNPAATEPVHFLQIWLLPRRRGGQPRWAQRAFTPADRAGRLLAVVSGDGRGTLAIDQDATMYIAALGAGEAVKHAVNPDRRAYVFVIDGGVELNGDGLAAGDQARISGAAPLEIHATRASELLLIDLP
ncbi:MAG: quercetin 2,3-dioxygenase [Candidatus Rokuibacteriota bacterium]|nr:MAG: quercetin 2,3-dioxygenase [Candidatus Rokubacteria bacterium]